MRIDCEGAPRDLGLDQGRAIGEGVDAELARILRERRLRSGLLELGRDVERHFPHLAERMAGLACGAGVERSALVVALARAAREPDFLFRAARAAGAAPPVARHAVLGARFDLSAERCSTPVMRRSEPQGGFPSLELTLPWLATSLGGVNAAGLAAVLAPSDLGAAPDAGLRAESRCRAPALLFVQQCLERFDRVDTALDWCLSRPSDGSASILLADTSGRLVGLAFDGDRRRMLEPTTAGVLWSGGGAPDASAAAALGAALATEAGALPGLLGDGAASAADPLAHRAYLWVDAEARSLAVVLDPEGLVPVHVERFGLEPVPGAA